MNLKQQLKEDLKDRIYNEDEFIDKVLNNVHGLFEKIVVRNCFKTDRDYKIAVKTLLELTGIDYEQEIN